MAELALLVSFWSRHRSTTKGLLAWCIATILFVAFWVIWAALNPIAGSDQVVVVGLVLIVLLLICATSLAVELKRGKFPEDRLKGRHSWDILAKRVVADGSPRSSWASFGTLLLGAGATTFMLARVYIDAFGFVASSWLVLFASLLLVFGALLSTIYGNPGFVRWGGGARFQAKVIFFFLFLLIALPVFTIVEFVPALPAGQHLPDPLLLAALVQFFGGLLAGLVPMAVASARWDTSVLVLATKLFMHIQPEKRIRVEGFWVMKKGNIYILIPEDAVGAYFVKLFDQAPVRASSVRLPMVFSATAGETKFRNRIAGVDGAKSRGEIVIPVDAVKGADRAHRRRYVKGTGLSYLVPFHYEWKGRPAISNLTKTKILDILAELSRKS